MFPPHVPYYILKWPFWDIPHVQSRTISMAKKHGQKRCHINGQIYVKAAPGSPRPPYVFRPFRFGKTTRQAFAAKQAARKIVHFSQIRTWIEHLTYTYIYVVSSQNYSNYSPSPLEIGSISLHCDPTTGGSHHEFPVDPACWPIWASRPRHGELMAIYHDIMASRKNWKWWKFAFFF